MTNLILINTQDDEVISEKEIFDELKGKKFIVIYDNDEGELKSFYRKISNMEACWILNIALHELMGENNE